jgi:hypothetical protein
VAPGRRREAWGAGEVGWQPRDVKLRGRCSWGVARKLGAAATSENFNTNANRCGGSDWVARAVRADLVAKPSYGGVVVNWVRRRMVWGLALPGRWRGGTGGRSSLIDCGVRLICEGFTSRPGVRRGSPSKHGRCQPEGLAAHRAFASLRATVLGLPGARARPGSVPGAMVGVWLVKGCCLP